MKPACLSFLVFILLFGSHSSRAQGNDLIYHRVQEKLPNGTFKIKIIAEDLSLRDDQSRISQRLIKSEADKNTPLPKAGRPLWTPSKSEWTDQDEINYSQWFASQVRDDFNLNSKLMADCADVGLLFRWVYARNNSLPMANTLIGGKLFGHFSGSSDWDKLGTHPDWKKDERFKAALHYLFENTYTHSIVEDMYPTFVSSQYIRPGSMYMIIRPESGHTQTISNIDLKNKNITTLWGNEPSAENIYTSPLIVEFQNKVGFLLWRHLINISGKWLLEPPEKHAGYSLEQYNPAYKSGAPWMDWIYQKLEQN